MRKNSFLITVKLSGVNLNRIYKECLSNDIEMYNINRIDYKNIVFDIEKSKLKEVKRIAQNQNYEFFVLRQYGVLKLFSFLTKRIGILVGIAIFLLTTVLSPFFVFNIKIYGNKRVESGDILSILNTNGINCGSMLFNANFEQIEKKLLDNLDELSLCSVVKKGSVVIVNVKEKLFLNEAIDTSQKDIVATQNMTIRSLSVVQGTALKKIGDSVKAGEVIVAGYFLDTNGQRVECKANASIGATVWFSKTQTYQKIKPETVRTGKKIVNSKMTLFGANFFIKNEKNTFESFDTVESVNPVFKNNILPFYLLTTIYYETTTNYVEQNFERDKQTVLQNLEREVLSEISNDLSIAKTFNTINETQEAFVVTFYAQVDVDLWTLTINC